MRSVEYVAITFVALTVAGCGKKEESEVAPPGFCKTPSDCQPTADRQNAYQNELRDKLISQGVREQYLPCGNYVVTKAPNGYWSVTRDTAGCPATASQPDPHTDLGKAKKPH